MLMISDTIKATQQQHTNVKDIMQRMMEKIKAMETLEDNIREQLQEREKVFQNLKYSNAQVKLAIDNNNKLRAQVNNITEQVKNNTEIKIMEFQQQIRNIMNHQIGVAEQTIKQKVNDQIIRYIDMEHRKAIKTFETQIGVKSDEVENLLITNLDSYRSMAEGEAEKWWKGYKRDTLPELLDGLRKSTEENVITMVTECLERQLPEFEKKVGSLKMTFEDDIQHIMETKGSPIKKNDNLLYRKDLSMSEKLEELNRRNRDAQQEEEKIQITKEMIEKTKTATDKLSIFRNKEQIYSGPMDNPPKAEQVERFYSVVTTSMTSLGLPIVKYKDLVPGGSTKPTPWPLLPETETTISMVLFEKLLASIPNECSILHDTMQSYQKGMDGYEALFAIMTQSCAFLQKVRPRWGPTWKQNDNGHIYLSTLMTYLDTQERYNKTYTKYEVAAEIIQQAHQHDRYRLIAVTLLSKLQDYDGIEEVPKEFTPHRLISTLEATPNSGGIIQMKQQSETDIYVNKMRFGDNNKKQV